MAPRVWPAADREREIAEQPTWQLCLGASSCSYSALASIHTVALASIPTAPLCQLSNSAQGHLFLILWQAYLLHCCGNWQLCPGASCPRTLASILLPTLPGGHLPLPLHWQAYLLASTHTVASTLLPAVHGGISSSYSHCHPSTEHS